MAKKRKGINIAVLNFAKGVAIIMVVLAHIVQDFIPIETGRYLSGFFSVLMPLFIILSGYLFNVKDTKTVLKNNMQGILKPYLVVQLFNMVLFPIRSYLQGRGFLWGIKTMGSAILLASSDDFYMGDFYVGTVGPVWFLFSLFFAWLILNLILQGKSIVVQRILVTFIAVLGIVLANLNIRVYMLSPICVMVGFLYIGYWFKAARILEKEIHWAIYVILAVIAVLSMRFSTVHIANNQYGLGVIEYFAMTVISFWLLKLFICLGRKVCFLIDWISEAGRYSLWVLCVHSVLFTSMPWQMFRRIIPNPVLCILFLILYNMLFIVLGCLIIKNWRALKERISEKIRKG